MTSAVSLATAVTFVWLGMVLAISSLEASLTFAGGHGSHRARHRASVGEDRWNGSLAHGAERAERSHRDEARRSSYQVTLRPADACAPGRRRIRSKARSRRIRGSTSQGLPPRSTRTGKPRHHHCGNARLDHSRASAREAGVFNGFTSVVNRHYRPRRTVTPVSGTVPVVWVW